MAKLLGQRSCTAWAGLGRTGEHKHAVAAGSDRLAWGKRAGSVLPLLLYWISSTVKKVLMLCRYRAVTTDFFFIMALEMKFPSNGREVVATQRPLLFSILQSFIGLWVQIWHRNKTACSELNPVQSRSKSMTCPWKESENCAKWNFFKSNLWFYVECDQMYWS